MPVKVEILVHNMDLSDRLKEYVTKKVSKLDRYLDTIEDAKVDLSFVKSARSANDRQVAQLTLRGKGVLLRAEERTKDIYASIDAALDKLERQIARYKGKRWRGRGDGRSTAEAAPDVPEASPDIAETPPIIARRKRFQLTPMDESEAIEHMELLGHQDFFVFYNGGTHQVNVLYRRRDGTLGLIETEVA